MGAQPVKTPLNIISIRDQLSLVKATGALYGSTDL